MRDSMGVRAPYHTRDCLQPDFFVTLLQHILYLNVVCNSYFHYLHDAGTNMNLIHSTTYTFR